MRKTLALMLIALLVSACSRKIVVRFPPQQLTVMIYENGKVAQHCKLQPDSDKFKQLASLMGQQDTEGWQKNTGTSPPTALVEGSEISLNFSGSSVILNDAKGQYVHPISADAYAFLRCRAN